MADIQQALDQAMPDIQRRFLNELVLACPFDTGLLRISIKVKITKKGLIIFMKDYGKYVEWGTPPHIIKPKSKKALKFKSGSKTIFAKEIKHPGTRPTPFIRNTIQNKLKQIIVEEINNNL